MSGVPIPVRARRGGALVLVGLMAYGAGVVTGVVGGSASDQEPVATSVAPVGVLDEAARQIAAKSAQTVDRRTLEQAGINGMLRALGDEWSRYLTPTSYQSFRDALAGRYSGVGLWLTARSGHLAVSSVIPSSAAARAGVMAGDRVTEIDGSRASSLQSATEMLRGPAGTTATLTVTRDGILRTFQLRRSAVASKDLVVTTLRGGYTVIRLAAFTRGVGGQIRALVDARGVGTGVVLDLRGNPGGLVSEAVGVASAFLDGGQIVSYIRRNSTERVYEAPRGGQTTLPLVVLVDGGTASAAEIVTAALQDRNRAVVVGARTYGKGSVQEPTTLSDGSALELTVGRYRTPAGRVIDKVGVAPDVEVSAMAAGSVAERRAVEVLRGLIAASVNAQR